MRNNSAAAQGRFGMIVFRLATCTLLIFLFGAVASAQRATDGSTPSGLSPGSPAGSYTLSDFDTVNLYNGTLNFRLPLLKVGGRGGAGFPIYLSLQQKWVANRQLNPGSPATYWAEANWWNEDGFVSPYAVGRLHIRRGKSEQFDLRCGTYVPRETLTRLTFTAPDGTEYDLRDQQTDGQPVWPVCDGSYLGFNRGKVFVTADGSSATFISDADIRDVFDWSDDSEVYPSGFMLLKDGTRFRVQNAKIIWMRDRNGNLVNFTYDIYQRLSVVTDSLGRQVTITYADANTNTTYDEIKFNGFGGAQRSLKLYQSTITSALRADIAAQPATSLFPELEGQGTLGAPVVSAITLPDNRQYVLKYNRYGELARVELPTGGAFEYDYAAGLTGTYASGVFILNSRKYIYRRVIERRVYPDGATGSAYANKTTYSRPETTTANAGYVTEEQCTSGPAAGQCDTGAALLGRVNHYFYGSPRTSFAQLATRYGSWNEGREWKTEVVNPQTNAVLRQTDITWQQPLAGATWPLGTAETNDAAKINSPQVTQVLTTLGDTNQVSKQSFSYDRYGNQTENYEYDFGAGAPGALVRRTSTTYVTTNTVGGVTYDYACDPGTTCSNASINKDVIHLRSLAARQSVYDAANVEQSRTAYEYDNYSGDAGHAALVGRPGITGLCTTFDAAGNCANAAPTLYLTRGNVTGTSKYLIAGGTVSGALSAYQQFDVGGNVVKNVDAAGGESTINYADAFCNGSACGGAYTANTYAFASSTATAAPDVSTAYGFPAGTFGSVSSLVTSNVYDFYTGLPYSVTDPNGQTTFTEYNDLLDRPTAQVRPGSTGGRTDIEYAADGRSVRILADLDATRRTESKSFFDGLGRVVRTQRYENADPSKPWITVDTEYDALGRVKRASMPYRWAGGTGSPFSTDRWTESAYDNLGRVSTTTSKPDNAVMTTGYNGNRVLIKDQAGKEKVKTTDALGRVTAVWEVTPAETGSEASTVAIASFPGFPEAAAGYYTAYSYDALGNLRMVEQAGQRAGQSVTQRRFFAYDSLSRLVRAKNPEEGNITADADFPALTDATSGVSNNQWSMGYVYDANNNIVKKKDGRGVVVTSRFDRLNRNIITSYAGGATATPDARHYFDGATNGLGHLYWSEKVGLAAAVFDSYDSMGRPTQYHQVYWTGAPSWGQPYYVSRAYNKAGNVITQTYPSGHTVNYNYDAAGRLGDKDASSLAMTGNLGDGAQRTYSSEVRYNEMGGREQERFGTDTPVYNKGLYNKRGQLAEIRVSTYSITSAGHETDWNRGAIINHYSTSGWGATGGGADNNGNLLRQEIYVPDNDQMSSYTNVVQEYGYDALNRINAVFDKPFNGSPDFYQLYKYDRWGNRAIDAGTVNAPEPQFSVDATTNRLGVAAGYTGTMNYDGAGNLINDSYTSYGSAAGAQTRFYDGEGRMTSAQVGPTLTATYGYDADGRRVKRNAGYGGDLWQIYGMAGELLAEYPASTPPQYPSKEYGYRGAELLVTADGSTAPAAGNTGFESPNVGGGGYQYNPAGGTWTFAGGTGVSGNGSAFTYGNPAAPEGAQVGFIQGGNTSVISQSVSGFQSGTRYTVTFKAAQRGNAGQPGQDFDVYLDTTLLGTFVPPSTSYTQASTASFTTTAGAHTLKFVGRNTNGGDNTAFIDGVSVVAGVKVAASSVTASGSWNGNVPAYAADGSTSTTWVSGGFPQQWVQLDLGSAYTLSSVRLDVNQNPAGATTHQVWGGPSPDQMSLLGTLSGNTQNGQWIELATAAANVRYVKVLTTSGPSWVAWTEIEVYADSASAGGGVNWLVADQLGTPRMVLDKTGSLSGVTRHDYLPFGEMVPADPNYRTTTRGYVGDDVRQKFTAHERDDETGLDYAEARYYSSALGRFTSPDEVTKDSKVGDPQSWNKYAYVRNNPLQLTDPTGEKAGVVVETAPDGTRTITITGTIAIWADKNSGISQEELNKAAQMMQDQINNGWSGTYEENGVKYNVKTEMKVEVVQGDPSASKADNVIQMTNGTFNFQGKVAHGAIEPRAYFGGPDTGRINIRDVLSGNNVAKHEFGHMLGVGDRYEDEHHDALMFGIYGMPAQAATSKDFGWALSGVIGEHDDKLAEYRYFGPAPGVTARSIVGHKPGKTSSTLRAPYVFWN